MLAVLQLSPNRPWIGHCKPAQCRVQHRCLLAGPQLDLPHDVTPKQLETLLNGLLKQEEKLPYSFFVNEQQLAQELGSHLLQHKVNPYCIVRGSGFGLMLLEEVTRHSSWPCAARPFPCAAKEAKGRRGT